MIAKNGATRGRFVIIAVTAVSLLIFAVTAVILVSYIQSEKEANDFIGKTYLIHKITIGEKGYPTDNYIVSDAHSVPLADIDYDALFNELYGGVSGGIHAVETRFRYPISVYPKDINKKGHEIKLSFDYGFILLGEIGYGELNELIGSYFSAAEDIFDSVSLTDFTREGGLCALVGLCDEYIDNHKDPRVVFRYDFSGAATEDVDIPYPRSPCR